MDQFYAKLKEILGYKLVLRMKVLRCVALLGTMLELGVLSYIMWTSVFDGNFTIFIQ